MSNITHVNLNFASGSPNVTVADGTVLKNILPGDLVFVVGYLPLRIEAFTSNSITLTNNAPLSGSSVQASIVAGTVPVRDLFDELKSFSEAYADWFSRMETWLGELGTVDVLGPSGTSAVSTLPQIVLDASNATQQAQAALTLIGDAPQHAADAEAARDTALIYRNQSQQAVTDAQAEVGNAAAQVALATTQASLGQGYAGDALGYLNTILTYRNQSQQAVTDAQAEVGNAAAQVVLAADEKTAAAGHASTALDYRNTTLIYRNEAETFRNEAQQAVNSVSGAMFPAGGWDASSNTLPPTPSNGSPYYVITAPGTLTGRQANINDTLYWNSIDSQWFLVDNTSEVFSVAGKTGAITLDASDISSGVFAIDRIPDLPTSKITTGTFSTARIPNLSASKITSGTLPTARGGTGRTDGKAVAWATARTLTLTGDVSGSVSIDGSGNMSLSASVANNSHNHTIANVSGLQSALDAASKKIYYSTGNVTVSGPERVHHIKRWGTGTGTISIDTSALTHSTHSAVEIIIDNVREDSGTATVTNLDGTIYLPDGSNGATHTAEGMGHVILEFFNTTNDLMMRAP